MSCGQTLHPTTNNQLCFLPAGPRYSSRHQWRHPGLCWDRFGSARTTSCVHISHHLLHPRIPLNFLFVTITSKSRKSCCCRPFNRAHDTLEKQTASVHLHISTGVVWLHSYLTAEGTAGRWTSPWSGTWDREVLNGWAVFITNFLTPDDLRGPAIWPAHVKAFWLSE